MNDEKKQIEEMAKDIEFAMDDAKKRGWRIKNAKEYGWDVEKLLPILIAEQISEKYQPKLSEDSVVLSREELDEMLELRTQVTIERLLDILWNSRDIKREIQELAKQFNIEIKE